MKISKILWMNTSSFIFEINNIRSEKLHKCPIFAVLFGTMGGWLILWPRKVELSQLWPVTLHGPGGDFARRLVAFGVRQQGKKILKSCGQRLVVVARSGPLKLAFLVFYQFFWPVTLHGPVRDFSRRLVVFGE